MNTLRSPLLSIPSTLRPLLITRLYATQTGLGTTPGASPKPRRKVTPFNDDGRIAWGELSTGEKAARTTQQTFNFSFILVGAVLTAGVSYVMYTEVFSPSSSTVHFNKAVNRITKDAACIALLGDSKKITAYGEPTWNKWARARPIASSTRKDQHGRDHMIMHFNVSGPLATGVVNLHKIRHPPTNEDPSSEHVSREYVYKYLTLDVPGHQRVYLERSDGRGSTGTGGDKGKGSGKIFGVSWR